MKRFVVGMLAVSLIAQPAWAARTGVHEAAESPAYGRKFGGMIGRGAINVVTSFMDLLVNIVNETKQGPALVGTLVGIGKGAGCTTLRTLSGAVDLTTFWVPGFNGFPVSDSYDNCLESAGGLSSDGSLPMSDESLTFREPSSLPAASGDGSPAGAQAAPASTDTPKYAK